MPKNITSQVSIVWCNTYFSCTVREVIRLQKIQKIQRHVKSVRAIETCNFNFLY